ncbi:MAG: hypothetical protein K9N40_12340 [Candidatus Cloacimonetes bacterium]|nr:hypothetical protein [Candidatus Cloacimonadota bacterium]
MNKEHKKFPSEITEKKLLQMNMLYEMAWELKRSYLAKKHPELSEEEIKKLTARIFMLART